MPPLRRLTAILAADVAGYSRLMGADEEGTHERLKAHLGQLVEPKIKEHRGHTVKNTGDGLLAEFPSMVDAVRCAVEVQRAMANHNAGTPPEKRIDFRVGINLGDVIAEGEDIFGDGVNVAARLEALAEPGGICVSRVVRDQVRDKLDLAFEDMGEQQVKNIARPVRVYRVRDATTKTPQAPAQQALPLPDKPSIAVLPFQNMSGDPEQEYFADGMVEEITTALSRIRWLFVIARNSSFTYKRQAVDVKQVGREMGVRYVLEGSVRKAGGRVRITAQLIDALSGTHLWVDRFDGSLEDVFDLQDQVAISVAGVIEPTLQAAEIRRSFDRPTNDLTAYDLYLRALPDCLSWDRERIHSALQLLKRAIDRDPGFSPALALAAVCHQHLHRLGEGPDPEAHRRAAIDYAGRGLHTSPEDPGTMGNVAFVLGAFAGDIQPAIVLADRALELNPSFARGWGISGWLRLWAGDLEVAVEQLETACRLSPREGNARYRGGIGEARFLQRRYGEAISILLAALEELPGNADLYRHLASCYAHAGQLDEAREIVSRLRAVTRSVVPDGMQWRNPEHRQLYLSGLRLAAGEET
jgi:adenylate cyclase